MLTVIVFVHEMGHYLVARWNGIAIQTFSLGFGPELIGFNDKHGTRWQIAAVYILEYGFLGVSTGIIALAAGSLAASLIAGNLLKMPFVFDSGAAFLTIAGGGAATLLFGLFGALAAMGARPAARLRSA